jgi:hypothetical protein
LGNVYVRENQILDPLDHRLAKGFDPETIDATAASLEAALEDPRVEARRESARQVRRCDDRLAKYRDALDAGVDPIVFGQWITEVQGQRLRAVLAVLQIKSGDRMTKDQIKAIVAQLGDVMHVLKSRPRRQAYVDAQVGLRVTYQPHTRTVTAEARQRIHLGQRVSEGVSEFTTWLAGEPHRD